MPDNEIIQLIEKIRVRYERIKGPSGNVIRIESDLMLADIRELYEKLSTPAIDDTLLNTDQQQWEEVSIQHDEELVQSEETSTIIHSQQEITEVKPDQYTAEPVLEFIAPPEDTIEEPIADLLHEDENTSEILSPTLPAGESDFSDPAIIEQPFSHQGPGRNPATGTQGLDLFGTPLPTLAEKLGEEKRLINERLNSEPNTDKSIGSKLRQPVTDLKTAIGINDRFHFINELFEGDMRHYDEMLTSLNLCASLQDAISMFEIIKIQRGWTDDLESVHKLLDFIHRRYA